MISGLAEPWHVQLEDVAGNVITPTQPDIDALRERLKGSARGLPELPLVGDIQWSTSSPVISLQVADSVKEDDLHTRLQSVGYTGPTRCGRCSTSPKASTCAAAWNSSAACTRTTARWCPPTTKSCIPPAASMSAA